MLTAVAWSPESPTQPCPAHLATYLWVLQAAEVRVQVELDALTCTRQRQPTNQQHQQHGKWEGGREVDDLQGQQAVGWGLVSGQNLTPAMRIFRV